MNGTNTLALSLWGMGHDHHDLSVESVYLSHDEITVGGVGFVPPSLSPLTPSPRLPSFLVPRFSAHTMLLLPHPVARSTRTFLSGWLPNDLDSEPEDVIFLLAFNFISLLPSFFCSISSASILYLALVSLPLAASCFFFSLAALLLCSGSSRLARFVSRPCIIKVPFS
jgi:hypothetical protein